MLTTLLVLSIIAFLRGRKRPSPAQERPTNDASR